MKALKKFWIWFVALLPVSSWALPTIVTGGLLTIAGLAGISFWRNISPVSTGDALSFFSSCWTCQIFTNVVGSLSDMLPKIYSSLGKIVIPVILGLFAIMIAWRLFSNFLNGKPDDGYKFMGNMGAYIVKITVAISLLLIGLPRLLTSVIIEPAVTLGTSLNYMVSDKNEFSKCMVATAVTEPELVSIEAASYGAFSPKLRHQLACEIASVHQVTGLGMTVGWAMLNMGFETRYMHKILSYDIPILPNIPMLLIGVAIIIIYFLALLPIPVYFLNIFVTLALDLVMLPLMLLSWVFDEEGFTLLPKGGRTIRQMIDDVFKAVVGIAITVVFLGFAVMFLNALFNNSDGIKTLTSSLMNNDMRILMDGMVLKDSNLLTIIIVGIFIAMFMTMIPQLTNTLFNVQISDEAYKTAKSNWDILWGDLKKWASSIKK